MMMLMMVMMLTMMMTILSSESSCIINLPLGGATHPLRQHTAGTLFAILY